MLSIRKMKAGVASKATKKPCYLDLGEHIRPPGTVHGTVRSGRPWRVGRADASATGPDVPAAGRIRRVPPARARVRPVPGEVAEGGTALPPPVAG